MRRQTGQEFSAVAGFTYNCKNQDTQYQNGIDFHLDWGVSEFPSL
ncbi:transporter [Bradyrhizobium cenepequi]